MSGSAGLRRSTRSSAVPAAVSIPSSSIPPPTPEPGPSAPNPQPDANAAKSAKWDKSTILGQFNLNQQSTPAEVQAKLKHRGMAAQKVDQARTAFAKLEKMLKAARARARELIEKATRYLCAFASAMLANMSTYTACTTPIPISLSIRTVRPAKAKARQRKARKRRKSIPSSWDGSLLKLARFFVKSDAVSTTRKRIGYSNTT